MCVCVCVCVYVCGGGDMQVGVNDQVIYVAVAT